jgi:DNA polymerase
MDQTTKKWGWVETYGGRLVENLCQAIARDLLAYSMLKMNAKGFNIVMHVHDEVVCEEVDGEALKKMCSIMGQEVEWAKGLPLGADGYVTKYYKKD